MDGHCHVDTLNKTPTAEEQAQIRTVVLAVWGMGCPNCAARVHNSLVSVRGVTAAFVDHQAGAAEVFYNPGLTDTAALVQAVARAGGDGRHEYRAQVWQGTTP